MIILLILNSIFIRILSKTYEIKQYFNSLTFNSSKTINLYYQIEKNFSQLSIVTFLINDSSIYSLTKISIKSKIISLNSKEEIPLNFPISENDNKQYLFKELNNIDNNLILEKEKIYNLYYYNILNENENKIDFLLIEIYLNKSNNDEDSILFFSHSKNKIVNIENNSNGKINVNNLEISTYFLIHFNMSQIDQGNFFFQLNNDFKNIYIEKYNINFEGQIIRLNDFNLIINYNKKFQNEIISIGLFYLNNSFIIDKKNLSLNYFFSKYDYLINDYDFDKQKFFPIQIESCFKPIHFIFNLSKNDNFSYFIVNEKIFGDFKIYNKQLNETIKIFNNNIFEFNKSFINLNNDFIEISPNYSILKYEFLYPSILNIRLIKIQNIIIKNEIIIGEDISSIYHINFNLNNNYFKFILTSQMYKKIQIKILNNIEKLNISINYLNETNFISNNNLLYELDLKQDDKSFILSNIYSNNSNYLIEITQKKDENFIELVTLEENKILILNTLYFYIKIKSIQNLFNYKIVFERNKENFLNYTYIYSLLNSDFYINKNLSSFLYPFNYSLKILNPFKYNFDYYLILIKFPSIEPTKLTISINKPINFIYPNSFININQNKNESSNFTIISNFQSEKTKILFQFFNNEQNENRILNNKNQKLKFQLYDINMEKISYNETNISINNNIETFNSYNYFSDYILIFNTKQNLFFYNLFLYISFINPKNFNESNYEEKNITVQITNETNANITIPKINKSNISISTKYNVYISENLSLSKFDIFSNIIEPNDSIFINENDNNSNYEYNIKNLRNNTKYILYILNTDEQTYYIYNKLLFKTGKQNIEQNEKNNSNNLPYYWIILLIIICTILICIFLTPILYYCYYIRRNKIRNEENYDNNDLESENKNTKAYPSSATIEVFEGRQHGTRLSTNMSFNNALHKHK